MQTQSSIPVSRTGFRKYSAKLTPEARAALDREAPEAIAFKRAEGVRRVLLELRPATYCGPGSAGDSGAYVLTANGAIWTFIYPSGYAR